MSSISKKQTHFKGAQMPHNLKNHIHITHRKKKISEPKEVFIPGKNLAQPPAPPKHHKKIVSISKSTSDHSSDLDQSSELPTYHDLSPSNENRSIPYLTNHFSFTNSSLPDCENDSQRNSVAENLVEETLKCIREESITDVPEFIKDIVNEIITCAYHGLSIERNAIFSSSSEECDKLSSLSVIGTGESQEDRDGDLIPDVEFIEEDGVRDREPLENGYARTDTLDTDSTEDDLKERNTVENELTALESSRGTVESRKERTSIESAEFLEKTFMTEPDIEVFDGKLSDKIKREMEEKEEREQREARRSNIMIVEKYNVDDHPDFLTNNLVMRENKQELKKNMKKKALDSDTTGHTEKKRDACCGLGVAPECKVF